MQTKQERQPTDLLCLYVFVTLQILYLMLGVYAFTYGDTNKIAVPYDSDHQVCNVDLPEYPYLYFVTPQQNFLYRTVCVKECPNANSTKIECHPTHIVQSCAINPSIQNLSSSVLLYNTITYKGQVCIPTTEYYYKLLKDHLYPNQYQMIAKNVSESKWTLLIALILSGIVSLLIIIYIEKYANVMLWLFVTFISISFTLAGLLCIYIYTILLQQPALSDTNVTQMDEDELNQQTNQSTFEIHSYLLLGIMFIGIAVFSILVALLSKERVKKTIKFIKVGGDFLKSNHKIFIIPLLCFIVAIFYCIYWINQSLYLYSIQQVPHQQFTLPYETGQTTTFQIVLEWFNLLMLFWTLGFIIGCCEYMICGSVCEWYYHQGNRYKIQIDLELQDIISNVIKRTLRLHLGSVALGSLIIGFLSIPRFFIELLYQMTGGAQCTQFFEKNLLSLTKYGYVLSNQRNDHFIQSSLYAKQMILLDLQTYLILGGLGEQFMMIGRLFIASFSFIIVYIFCIQLPYGYVIGIISFLFCFSISSLFMAIYGMSAEAIYILYVVNKIQSPDEQPQCTVTLQQILDQMQQVQQM